LRIFVGSGASSVIKNRLLAFRGRARREAESVAEESKKFFRAAIPEAVQAARDIIADPAHKDRARVAMALIDRVDPVITHHNIGVTHRIVG
jgi:hypothetical protein